jgi:dimethylaniline monooxygenase (N-oxide forming)
MPAAVNETLVQHMAQGDITNLYGIERFTKSGLILQNGQSIDCDAVIVCAGYIFDYSILPRNTDPTIHEHTEEWSALPHVNGLPYPKLYQTLFHTTHPLSLAFIGPCSGFSFSALSNGDLSSQAIAQVWTGRFKLPGGKEIERWCEREYQRAVGEVSQWRVPQTGADSLESERWLCEAAGNGVFEHLGWGLAGWKFWWKNTKLYYLIMDGINTPAVYRLFDGRPGGRAKWAGAKEEILKVNGVNL